MIIFGVDPGPKNKGCGGVVIDGDRQIIQSGIYSTASVCDIIEAVDVVVLEMISCYGMAVGMSTFQTLIEAGRIVQATLRHESKKMYLVPRKDIKMVICGSSQAKDANVRQAILDLYPTTGGGKNPQVGTKGQPGPLYGMSSHVWPALAAALTYLRMDSERASMKIETFRYTETSWNGFIWGREHEEG